MGLLDDAIREHLDLKRRRGADPAEVERAEREALGPVRRAPEEPEPAPPADAPAAFDQQVDTEWGEPEGFAEPAGHEHIPAGVVEPEAGAPEFGEGPPTELHDPFADEPEPFETQQHESQHYESERYEPEPPAGPSEPEPLTLEQQPRRRGFLGRRKQRDAPPEPEHYADELDDEDDPFADPPQAAAPPPPHAAAGDPPPPHPAAGDPPQGGRRGDTGGETVEYEVEAAFEAEGQSEGDDLLEETPEFLEDTPDHDRLWFEQRPPRDFDFDG